MATKKLYPFVLNDENVVNSYGFRVRNAGINFKQFDDNPVMLDGHINKTDFVRGNWQNRRIEGSKLMMDANFDTDLPAAATLEGQVDRKFVKGASPGLAIDWSVEPFERQPDGNWDLIKSTMVEGSVCPVPSNAGALCQLYDIRTGEPIPEDEIKLSLQKLNADFKTPNTPNMEKIILSDTASAVLVGLNVANTGDVTQISNAIVNLSQKVKDAEKDAGEWKMKFESQAKLQAEGLADAALLNEQITKDERDEWVGALVSNFSFASKQLAKLPGKVSLTNKLINNSNNAGGDDKVKSIDDFVKLSTDAQLKWKGENPDAYKALFAK